MSCAFSDSIFFDDDVRRIINRRETERERDRGEEKKERGKRSDEMLFMCKLIDFFYLITK